MSRVHNILKGFGSLVAGDPLSEEQKKRVEICNTCPFKTFRKATTIIDKDLETKEVSGYTCDKCSCYLPAKVRVNEESCPVKKWTSIITKQSKNKK